jgi:FtsP/CotA-like multicopper oxidase with cupredoxin domain
MSRRERLRLLVALVATVVVVTPLAWMWWHSRLPDSYSVMDMGYEDRGGGPAMPAAHAMHSVSVADLTTDRARKADVVVDLVARKERIRLDSGRALDGYTLNHRSPGPQVDAVEGQLVEVRLRNESVPDGITLHWHGVDVPNAEDGVAGVTQDAVGKGDSHTYRFVAVHAGTYWYHSHQVSHEQVARGLLGPLVIHPRAASTDLDVVALSHGYRGTPTLNGKTALQEVAARPGRHVRLRVINTDNGAVQVFVTAPFRVLAVDGYDLHDPTTITDRKVQVAAGGRVDLGFDVPEPGAVVVVGGQARMTIGAVRDVQLAPLPRASVDLLSYGRPAALPFDPAKAVRHFRYSIGKRPGFVDGKPGLWWSINGHLFPDVPMFVVDEGDVVRMTISNHSGDLHPMHLHGHHAVVLSRNGAMASGSPWWVDSLDVASGDTYEIAFLADNPGIWMDHCHNLPHAQQGLVAHLMYSGVSEPFRVGGHGGNEPE